MIEKQENNDDDDDGALKNNTNLVSVNINNLYLINNRKSQNIRNTPNSQWAKLITRKDIRNRVKLTDG